MVDPSDFWSNLLNFGASTMQSGGQPGASLGGAIGTGLLSAQQYGRQGQMQRGQLGLMGAQTADVYSQAQQRQYQNWMAMQQFNIRRMMAGLPPLDFGGGGGNIGQAAQSPGVPQGGMQGGAAPQSSDISSAGADNQPSSAPAGMPHSPTAGATVRPPRVAGQPGGTPTTGQGMPQQNEPMVGNVPLAVTTGQRAPTKAEAMQMSNLYAASGDAATAKEWRDYAMKAPEGFQVTPGYGLGVQTGGPADPRYIGQKSAAEAWGKAPAETYVQAMAPKELRGPGAAYINPYFRQMVQVPNEINTVGPGGTQFQQFVPLGLHVTGQGPLSVAGGNSAAPPQRGPVNGFQPGGAPLPSGASVSQAPPSAPALRQAPAPPIQGAPNAPAPPAIPGATESFQTHLGPGQIDIMQGLSKNYAEEGRKSYESALSGLSAMEFINRDIETMGPTGFYAMGEGADTRAGFAKLLQSWENAAGIESSFDPNKIGAWEDFSKETKLLGMKGLSAIFGGSREAATIVNTSISAVPHPENTYQGAKLLSASYTNGFQHEIDQRNFETNWAQDPAHPGDLTGAKEAFNQQYPPTMYARRAISAVKPYPIKDQSELKRFLPGTHVVTPDGKSFTVSGPLNVPLKGQPQGQQ